MPQSRQKPPSSAKQHLPFYSVSPEWEDVEPIPSIDESKLGDPSAGPALATIAYSPRYSEAMSYLRAVMAANEFSDRARSLTEDIISMNPAHYTVWLYRMKILRNLWGVEGKDVGVGRGKSVVEGVQEELRWLDGVSEKNLKNYQIWHHRQSLISLLPALPETEIAFLTHILSFDSKNYHVWSYRQWLCRSFPDPLLHTTVELDSLEQLLQEDVRNNSAWNHRYFVVFGHAELKHIEENGGNRADFFKGDNTIPELQVDNDIVSREVDYAKQKIYLAPQNPSPWNYLKGVLKRAGLPEKEMKSFCEEFVRPPSRHVADFPPGSEGLQDVSMADNTDKLDFWSDSVRSSHAIDVLAEIYEEEGDLESAKQALRSLAEKWDPIRKKYWEFRVREMDTKTKT